MFLLIHLFSKFWCILLRSSKWWIHHRVLVRKSQNFLFKIITYFSLHFILRLIYRAWISSKALFMHSCVWIYSSSWVRIRLCNFSILRFTFPWGFVFINNVWLRVLLILLYFSLWGLCLEFCMIEELRVVNGTRVIKFIKSLFSFLCLH